MPCKRKTYPTRAAAQTAADRLKRKYGADAVYVRPVLCLDCHRFHLTNSRRSFAEALGAEIAADDLAVMRARLKEIGAEIRFEKNLERFRKELESTQAYVRKLLGLVI
jgi:hypothetical protein